ncbi:MAG: isoprenylcysteine carboxylmethyltransferase family protein [Anaerolineales bacterium]
MNQFKKWSEKEYGLLHRVIATLLAGSIFVVLIPYVLIILSPIIDQRLGLSPIPVGIGIMSIGAIFILVGLAFALWSILSQLLCARGTPLPMMATKKLLDFGPFKYCRNPMSFGTILIYLGIAVIVGSWSALILSGAFAGLLIIYLKAIEERELEVRFGEEYLKYKKETPFLIPKFPSRR